MVFTCPCTPNFRWFDNLSKSSLISTPLNPVLVGKCFSGTPPAGWQDRLFDDSAWSDPVSESVVQQGVWISDPPASSSEVVSFRKSTDWDATVEPGGNWLPQDLCTCYQLQDIPSLNNHGLTIEVWTHGVLLGCWLDGVSVTLTELFDTADPLDHHYYTDTVDVSIINDQAAEFVGIGAINPCIVSKPPLRHTIALQAQANNALHAGIRWQVHAEGLVCTYFCQCPQALMGGGFYQVG